MSVYLNIIANLTSLNPGGLPQTPTNSNTVPNFLKIVFGAVGALALLMITISGLRYITSAGDPQKTAKARNGIIYALVGLAIALTAEAIVTYVANNV